MQSFITSEVAFACRMGVPSTAKVLFADLQNLKSMLLQLKVEFASPKCQGDTFGVICTGKQMPMRNANADADNTLGSVLDFIRAIH